MDDKQSLLHSSIPQASSAASQESLPRLETTTHDRSHVRRNQSPPYGMAELGTTTPPPDTPPHFSAIIADDDSETELFLPPSHSSQQAETADSRNLRPSSADSEFSSDASEDAFGIDRYDSRFIALRPVPAQSSGGQPGLESRKSIRSEGELFRALSQRRKNTPGKSAPETEEERAEIELLMSQMFGQARQEHNEDQKSRHVGVLFRNLTVKGLGLGSMLQPTNGDFFLNLPRFLRAVSTKGFKAATAKPPLRDLLLNFNGCIRPGEMLLVLGAPGSGCSTFLKILGNQRFGYEAVDGEVTYGGTDAKRMAKDFRGEVVYNPEDDLHYATLTVRQTLEFALKTRTPGKDSRNVGESREDYVREFLRIVTKLFWIEHTLETKVGNEYIRGVSGGEKKRVSIAEAMITKASVQAWDNSTRGLDANTALEYVESIRGLTNMAQISTAVALYQAGESLYQLFDKVLLIDKGKCLYFGSADRAKQYFLDLGFECPGRWTTADFLTSVNDEHERNIRKGWEDRVPRSPAQFAIAYRNSDAFRHNLDDIAAFERELEEKCLLQMENLPKKEKRMNYTLPFHKQVLACTLRQFSIILGDKASLYGKWGGIVFQGLIVGSLFYNMPANSAGAFTRGGVLFLILLFNSLLALAEMTSAFSSKPILLKHKSFSFYRPSAYAIAQTVLDVPLVFMQVFLFDIVIYFMSGLQRTVAQFLISLLILWIATLTIYTFFRMLSSLAPTLDVASRFTGLAVEILIIYTGYLIPPRKMHPWFKWLTWINPVQYAFECLMANEFYDLELECAPQNLVPQGPRASAQYQSCTLAGSTPGQTIVNGANYIEVAFGYKRAYLWRNFAIMCVFFLFFFAMTCVGMELMKPGSGGATVTVFKRGQVPKKLEDAIENASQAGQDEESGNPSNEPTHESENSTLLQDTARRVGKNETVFMWRGVDYVIPYQGGKRKLLSDVQGFVRPGRLTALMGSSGAGKTTLLNTLAQRFGTVTGEFLVDGRPLPKSFQRATGFAEQMDIHEPTATVREALQFSALLRQPKEVPVAEKYEYCERILDLLEMQDIAGATIGKVGSGLNQEQRKRLTIGVELASKPELLMFLDEPTSGLDSQAAFNVVRFLRKLADAGQAILCTIHQPSAVLFEYFDELLLLKSGGRIVYHGDLGDDSRTLIDYFERNGAKTCPPDTNPAEYMLEAIGAGNPDYKGKDWADLWATSKERQTRSNEIAQMIQDRSQVELSNNLKDDREYAVSLGVQTKAVITRAFIAYWRTPEYTTGKFALHIITALFTAFSFYHVGFSAVDMQSRLFSIFMTLTISPPLIQQFQPVFLNSRNIFTSRENNSKIYSWVAWATGVIVVEIPYSLVAGGIYFCCWWFPFNGYRATTFASGYMFLMVCLYELYYLSFGQAITAFAPNELLASILVSLFFLFVVSFCGVLAPPAALPVFWRSWMYWLTPYHYLLEGMLAVTVHDLPVRCEPQEFAYFKPPPGETCATYTRDHIAQVGGYVQTNSTSGLCKLCAYATGDEYVREFSVYYSHRWRDVIVFVGFIFFNFGVVYLATWARYKGKNPFKGLLAKFKR